jgi:hypothetical protein
MPPYDDRRLLLPLNAVNAAEIEQTGASYELLAFDDGPR